MNVSTTAIRGVEAELERLRAENVAARHIIQRVYDVLVEYWGNDGSTLKDDFDYRPELNQIRAMHRWLHGEAAAATDEQETTR